MLIRHEGVWDLVAARAEQSPDALVAVNEHGREMTFGEYRAAAERVAAGLAEIGVHGGSRVAWQLPTWIESMVLVAALARLGATQIPMLPIYREREVGFIVAEASPSLFIVPSVWRGFSYRDLAERALRGRGGECLLLTCDATLPEGDPATLPAAPVGGGDGDGVRWIFYTSGTTADPKGALHSDRSLVAGSFGIAEAYGFSEADRYPMVFPFTHIGGVGMLLVQLISGAGAIITERFDPDTTMSQLAAQKMTLAAGGTPLALLYLAAQRAAPERRLFPDLRAVITGSAPKSDRLHHELRDELGGTGALSCYGLTEVPFLAVSQLDDPDEKRALTEGRPIAGAEVRIVADDGSPCPPGTPGEIRTRGPQVCLGYLNSALDRAAFDAEGFFRTGDLGALDAEGYVTIIGRIKDIIIRKGEKISAKEVEDVLGGHPGIADVAVIGRKDPLLGERCCAIVVLGSGQSNLELASVVQFCRAAGVALQKIPEELIVVESLPRNASGKILKYQLKERYP